ncbi:S41 family peptidase [Kitasatospora sp. NPDC085879]|uniref:S41 family peptidase n=1 Tax=Kitasatospora sp. NPDC085879 TaxID=3154769 RepID=UPI000BB10F39|nr:S41 family peptidase [Streptomyces sp. TLI_235]PBC70759.1 peptidase S41-like protein [Streptomyces sp. TLI_235]
MIDIQDILDDALAKIRAGYVFPDKVDAVDAAIRRRLTDGSYQGLAGPELCEAVTAHIQEACPDKHLRLLWNEEPLPRENDDSPEEVRARWAAVFRADNYGIRRVEQLDGNIGYLDLRSIPGAAEGGRAFAAAMELLAHTEALIIDLRHCRGGAPDGVALWCSYLFPDGEVHLNDIYDRATDSTRQFWTSAHVPGTRYADRPVYVLTSDFTFSGGEELAYNLQVNGRATLVGETTRGGAHPTERFAVTEHITVTVPTARSINPVTGTNWEGVGVVPDVAVPAGEALVQAIADALDRVRVGAAAR